MDIILVNERDEQIGVAEKMKAHEAGLLHRAFSVFLFNSKGEMLLQQRSLQKYHSPGLWTNACCSHPKPGEDTEAAAHRRLLEELNMDTKLEKAFEFLYEHRFDNGLTEHEYDHVYVGEYDATIDANKEEVKDTVYLSMGEIEQRLQQNPDQFTVWFAIALPKLQEWLSNRGS